MSVKVYIDGAFKPVHNQKIYCKGQWRDIKYSDRVFINGMWRVFGEMDEPVGSLFGRGGNYYGQLGMGDNADRVNWTRVGVASNWVGANGVGDHSVAINSLGQIFSCGRDTNGRLGQGMFGVDINYFKRIGSASNWNRIIALDNKTYAIALSGHLYVCGNVGVNSQNSKNVLTLIPWKSNWVDMVGGLFVDSAGEYFIPNSHYFPNNYEMRSLGVLADASVVRSQGSFGSGSYDYSSAMAIADGKLYAVGNNTFGQLGLGDNVSRAEWTRVGTESDWVDVGVGYRGFAVALNAKGETYATGTNYTVYPTNLANALMRTATNNSASNWVKIFVNDRATFMLNSLGEAFINIEYGENIHGVLMSWGYGSATDAACFYDAIRNSQRFYITQ